MSFTEALPDTSNVGLTSGEAAALLERWGKNCFGQKAKSNWLKSITDRLRNPLVCILLAAGFISALTGETGSFAIILMVISISIAMDICQQKKADDAVERLSASVALSARVLRDGYECRVPSDSIVPGDVVLLSAGDLIPADGVLLESKHLFVDQSTLSGESYPVEKVVAVASSSLADAAQSSDLDSASKCFAGSSISSGTAKLLISATGLRTVFGELSLSLVQQRSATSFDRELQSFGNLILRFTIVLVGFAFVINISFGRPLLQSLLFSVALAVGLTPELLPMIVTVTLARGALLMAKAKVIVKRLSAVQDLGSMDVLCTDKTGTLTEGKIELFKHIDLEGKSCDEVLRFAYLNSAYETGIKSPLDDAIMRAFHDLGEKSLYRKIDEVPFDFQRRRVSVLLEQNDRQYLCVKGAVEEVVSVCSDCKVGGRLYPIAEYRSRINNLFSELASSGFHILAVACRVDAERLPGLTVADEKNLTFLGFAAFLDPPKQSASAALRDLSEDGVDVKILSGDHELVARYVCNELQFSVTGSLTGADLDALDDQKLSLQIENTNLFCRVNPSQKNRIIRLLRKRDKIVGFLGDGINDAPSLHAADVGVSVDSAVDVAKQAADLVLLEHDLRVLHAGIREGRRAFSNVHKYIMMATSSNFGNMVSMAAASLILPFLPLLPFQILLNNLLYDLSELALPTDNVDEELLAKPCRENMSNIQKFMLTVGPISSIFDFITFFLLITNLKANQTLFHSGWFVESLATQILVIFVIRTRRKFWMSTPSAALVIASVSTLFVACLLTQTRLASLLQFTPLPFTFFIMLGVIAVIYLAIVAVVSTRFYAKAENSASKTRSGC